MRVSYFPDEAKIKMMSDKDCGNLSKLHIIEERGISKKRL